LAKLTKDQLAKKWGLPPAGENAPPTEKAPDPPPLPPKKKDSPLERVKRKKKKEDDEKPDLGELIELSNIAQHEQEISKAETMKYKAEYERLKLKRAAGEVMEFSRGELLFFGFIDKASFEMLRLMDKFEPVIKNLAAENDYKAIILTVNRELENILVNIQEEQNTAVEDWRKGLK